MIVRVMILRSLVFAPNFLPANAFMLVYDITKNKTTQSIEGWVKKIKKRFKDSCPFVIIGNKSDITELRKVTYEEGLEIATQFGASFFETSTVNSSNSTDLTVIVDFLRERIKEKSQSYDESY